MLKIGIPLEQEKEENRIALTPDLVSKYIAAGFEIHIEKGAGEKAGFSDDAFVKMGAKIASGRKELLEKADVVLAVRAPTPTCVSTMKKGSYLISLLNPYRKDGLLQKIADAKVTAFSLELVPRITRAQSMDILSSQANLAGYRSVIEAANLYNRAFPMMMTAAGTIAPARVFVMGTGVAGLQAIATARRMGAIVSATDVRPAAKEQVHSLGAQFVMVESEETKEAETAGGYAKEMSAEFKAAQAALIAETVPKQDIIITTALIPGRPAPVLVTKAMVQSMKPGSVIVDLAAEQGGNCELTKPGEVVTVHGVHIIGYTNLAGLVAQDASKLFAKNVYHLMMLLVKEGALSLPLDDEIIKAILMTHEGKIAHERFQA